MNNERRKAIRVLIAKLERAQEDFDAIIEGEQEYFDNMPENFQDGGKGEAAQEVVSNLEEAKSMIEDSIEALENATE